LPKMPHWPLWIVGILQKALWLSRCASLQETA
jgi:hypothetical protein